MTIVPFLHKLTDAVINPLILLGFAVGFVYFAYAVFTFLSTEGPDREKAKDNIKWTVVGLFIMVSVMGIINFVMNSFQIENPGVQNYFNNTAQ